MSAEEQANDPYTYVIDLVRDLIKSYTIHQAQSTVGKLITFWSAIRLSYRLQYWEPSEYHILWEQIRENEDYNDFVFWLLTELRLRLGTDYNGLIDLIANAYGLRQEKAKGEFFFTDSDFNDSLCDTKVLKETLTLNPWLIIIYLLRSISRDAFKYPGVDVGQ